MSFRRRLLPLALALSILLSGSACVGPAGRPVRLMSEPEGASISTSWGEVGVTPCKIHVPRGETGTVTVKHAGFMSREVQIVPSVFAVTAARVAFGLLMDVTEDDADQPARLLSRNGRVHIDLTPIEPSSR